MITGQQLELLCAFFNLKLFRAYFELLLSNGNYAYGSRDFFKNVPIVKESIYSNILISMVKEIYAKKVSSEDIINRIDSIIYKIYDLSESEKEYIENNYK